MNIVELRMDASHHLKQATIWHNTTANAVASREYPGKLLKLDQTPGLSLRPGATIPRTFLVEDSTATGMFGTMTVSEYSLLVEVP